MSLVSIIIPYYKKKDYILGSIKSVLNQTYQNFEIIIIYDDQDKNLSNVLNVANVLPDVQFFVNKVEHGVIKPVN